MTSNTNCLQRFVHSCQRYVLCTVIVAASLASGSVAFAQTIDPEQVRLSIYESLRSVNLGVESLDCPSNIPLRKGNRFECRLVLSGGKYVVVEVVQTDNEGTVDWQARGLILKEKLEKDIQTQIESQVGTGFTVNCGEDNAIVALKGQSFTCVVTSTGSQRRRLRVTPTNNFGNVYFSIE